MNRIQVGDTVAFRRNVINACDSEGVAQYRGTVTDVAGDWLFLSGPAGRQKVMPIASMCKVARNGVVLELVTA